EDEESRERFDRDAKALPNPIQTSPEHQKCRREHPPRTHGCVPVIVEKSELVERKGVRGDAKQHEHEAADATDERRARAPPARVRSDNEGADEEENRCDDEKVIHGLSL